ncbi:MAG TPA: 1,2-phenylacetyl-CoA epoxidase subunit PaaC, partial [Gemmatimonadaceae bacterium]|nr:1,2-phenylacetyl-CoA epoxidase subunit PaaC [Gemmatimonadaceae bacterium]
LQLVELPKGDFAFTIIRQFLFDAFSFHQLEELQKSGNAELAGIAAKGYKEVRYQLRHSSEWVLRLGDGTDESHSRAQKALDDVWRFTSEMFDSDEIEQRLVAEGTAVDSKGIEPRWNAMVSDVLSRATLNIPEQPRIMLGGRHGRHTEHLGHMLSEMQIVARSHPGAEW